MRRSLTKLCDSGSPFSHRLSSRILRLTDSEEFEFELTVSQGAFEQKMKKRTQPSAWLGAPALNSSKQTQSPCFRICHMAVLHESTSWFVSIGLVLGESW